MVRGTSENHRERELLVLGGAALQHRRKTSDHSKNQTTPEKKRLEKSSDLP